MMSVEEYALDVNKTVEEILKYCEQLGIKVSSAKQSKDDSIATGATAADCSSDAKDKLCQPAELPIALGLARSACSSNNQNSISWVYN